MTKKKTPKPAAKQTKRDKRAGGKAKALELFPAGRADEIQAVPSARRPKGGKVRLTSHKARSRWFQTRASWPVREASTSRLVRERARAEKALAVPLDIPAQWE